VPGAIFALPYAPSPHAESSAFPQAPPTFCIYPSQGVEVAGQPLGAWVTGLTLQTVTCENLTTGQAVTLSDHATAWDCEAAGLEHRFSNRS
jgi:hypothetical protein